MTIPFFSCRACAASPGPGAMASGARSIGAAMRLKVCRVRTPTRWEGRAAGSNARLSPDASRGLRLPLRLQSGQDAPRMLDSRANILLACALSALAGYVDGIGFLH